MGTRLAAGVAALVVVVLAAGCVAEEPPPAQDSPGVIVPGRPGEQASVVPPEKAGEHQQVTKPSEADVRYMTMMIPHHEQAITMTDLVPARARSERVKAIASRIAASQDAEIAAMTTWLEQHGHAGHTAHQHGLMPGMATPEQLDALRAAKGAEFDRQFLRLMITHHEGALTMARDQLAHGLEPQAVAMAQEVLTGQVDEIEHMRAMLGT
ncbi:DUF305 domain-containing protein [Prauserella muralis]|uniref:DUF305 domain-containing protein n=1 Tax=Prauserella muralis TaxID=588067 RepID=A0A2V4B4S3_9PSEU|nr:DUF305 domain-containing protein [Prauserella muralis]PXY28378.1 DUF305 domain-containing protein [Prauserella muralis]